MSIDLKNLTIDKIQAGFKSGDFTSEELTRAYLESIKKDTTNSFISINDKAIEAAKQADKKIKEGRGTELTGVPIAVKDTILVDGLKATAASKILENYEASFNATAVQRLLDEGMVVLGKTNCDEFAMGSSNETSAFGPVKNPHDQTKVPGGSSGGSAAAVAGNLAPVALGSDTGGSIRQPASFCGVVGVKPSYGRVSRYGLIALASSLDQIGPLTNSVKDSAYLLQAMAGYDKQDATSSKASTGNYFDENANKLKIGVPKEYFNDNIQKEIRDALEEKIEKLKTSGFKVEEVSLPNTEHSLAVYYILQPAEASSNLARYDGILYGMSSEKKGDLDEWYKDVRSRGFGDETRRRIMLGTYILSAGYYDAYYKKAQKVRTLIRHDFSQVFKQVDILLTPATPSTAFGIGEKSQDPMQMYLSDIFTVSANIAGVCGMSMPIRKDKNNLPIGMQLLADVNKEENLFSLGYFLEK